MAAGPWDQFAPAKGPSSEGPWNQFAPAAAPGPWDQFASAPAPTAPAAAGPWDQFASSAAPATSAGPSAKPSEAELKEQHRITPDEVASVATRHGANPDTVRNWTPFITGAFTEAPPEPGLMGQIAPGMARTKEALETGAHSLSSSLGLGAPAWLAKQTLDPKDRAALDELKALADERSSTTYKVGQGVLGLTSGIGVFQALGAASAAVRGGAAAVEAAPTLVKSVLVGAAIAPAQSFFEAPDGATTAGSLATSAVFGGLGGAILHGLGAAAVAGMQKLGSAAVSTEAEVSTKAAASLEQIGQKFNATAKDPAYQAEVASRFKAVREVIQPTSGPAPAATPAAPGPGPSAPAWWKEEPSAQAALPAPPPEQVQKLISGDAARETVQLSKWIHAPDKVPIPVGKPSEEALQTAVSHLRGLNLSAEQLEGAHARMSMVQDLTGEASDYVTQGNGVFTTPISKWGRKLLRGRAMYGIIDDRNAGITQLEPLSDELAVRSTAGQAALTQSALGAASAMRKQQQAGLTSLTGDQLQVIEHQADLSKISFLSDTQRDLLAGMKARYEAERQAANLRYDPSGKTERITEVAGSSNYIPRAPLGNVEAALAVRRNVADVANEAGVRLLSEPGGLTEQHLANLDSAESPAWEDLKAQLKWMHKGVDWNTPAELEGQLRAAVDPVNGDLLATGRTARSAPSASLMRISPDDPTIPNSLRETDLNRLEIGWMKQVYQHSYTHETVSALQAEVAKLSAVGDSAGAEYVARNLQDMAGSNPWRLTKALSAQKARASANMQELAFKADQAGQGELASSYRYLASSSDLPTVLASSMYSNLVGLHPSTIFKSVMAPWTVTMPEMMSGGGAWGMSRMLAAGAHTLQRLATSNPATLLAELHGEGWLPGRMSAELRDAHADGLIQGGLSRRLQKGVDALSQAALMPLSLAEGAGRLIAKQAGVLIAAELKTGQEGGATRFLDNMGLGAAQGIRDLMHEARGSKDWKPVEEALSRYVVGKTLQYYTPTQMSELGRDMGRVVSAFGTWPTSVAGDVARDYIRRGAMGGSATTFRKYIAPLGLLYAIQHVASAGGWDPTSSPRMKTLTGATGLTGASPFPEAGRALKPQASPEVESAVEGIGALTSLDPARMWTQLNKAGSTFVPGAFLVPLLDTTLPALIGNKAPPERGRTLTGRAMNLLKPGSGTSLDEAIRAKYGK